MKRYSLFIILLLMATSSVFAFRVTKRQTIRASVFVGVPAPAPEVPLIEILHTPLLRVSPVTRLGVFQGVAGSIPVPTTPVPFESRLKIPAPLPPEQLVMRVRLRYRFITFPGSPPPPSETAPILGPDPTPFAFQLTVNGVLEYQIIAERLVFEAGQHRSTGTVVYPPPLPGEGERWIRVNDPAQASQRVGPGGGRVVLHDGNPNDGETAIDIPEGIVPQEGATISVNEVSINDPFIPSRGALGDSVVAVYHYESEPPIRGSVLLSALYQDWDFPRGQKGTINGTSAREETGGLFWHDGHEWRRIGNRVNSTANTILTQGNLFGYVAVMAPVAAPSAHDQRPVEKVVTPNGDGINDLVYFNLADFGSNNKVEIFDITSRRIQTLIGGNVTWDGRDENGKLVESGVYIYQYEADGQTISGLIAVAK